MKMAKKIFLGLRECIEVYIPMLLFFIMFCVFVAGVFFRYVIRSPLTWSNEAVSICFLEMVLLSACYVQRQNGHVKFSMLMDMLPSRVQGAVGFVTNLLLLIAFLYTLVPCTQYILFLDGVSATPVFGISFHIVYFPFVFFLVLNAAYMAIYACQEFLCMIGKNNLHQKEKNGK